jgi:hypothetical protein
LVDMQTVTVGKMIIEVTETGLTARRAAGDVSKGYGSISRKPLNGEDVLVRRLSEAVSQAIEKGLASKVRYVMSCYAMLRYAMLRVDFSLGRLLLQQSWSWLLACRMVESFSHVLSPLTSFSLLSFVTVTQQPTAPKKKAAVAPVSVPEPVVAAAAKTSIQSSGTVPVDPSAGPRQAGAKRSTERVRGTRKKATSTTETPEEK